VRSVRGGANRTETGSTMNVTKKLMQLEGRLAEIESVQRAVLNFLAKMTDFAVESRENDMTLLRLNNEAAAERAELKQQWRELYQQEHSNINEVH